MTKTPSQTLILGLLSGLSLEKTKPFFLSLEKAGYRGDVCMVAGSLDAATQAFLRSRAYPVNFVPFQRPFLRPLMARLLGCGKIFMTRAQRRRFDAQLASSYGHLHCAPFGYYRAFLAECGATYDRVMIADVRDVLFQSDPFSVPLPHPVNFLAEAAGLTIGACVSNASWIRRGFGRAVLRELADKPISCAGTVIGSRDGMLNYVETMQRIFCQKKKKRTIHQATHNYILYKQPLPGLHCLTNEDGPVLTMGYVKPEQLRFNEKGLLLNHHGQVYTTLHQYDRHPELARRLLRLLT
jgi:hypothetical protein